MGGGGERRLTFWEYLISTVIWVMLVLYLVGAGWLALMLGSDSIVGETVTRIRAGNWATHCRLTCTC